MKGEGIEACQWWFVKKEAGVIGKRLRTWLETMKWLWMQRRRWVIRFDFPKSVWLNMSIPEEQLKLETKFAKLRCFGHVQRSPAILVFVVKFCSACVTQDALLRNVAEQSQIMWWQGRRLRSFEGKCYTCLTFFPLHFLRLSSPVCTSTFSLSFFPTGWLREGWRWLGQREEWVKLHLITFYGFKALINQEP